MSVITERAEHGTDQVPGKDCEAIVPFIGVDWPCPDPAAGFFRRACVHEHIRDGWLCRNHAESVERASCRTCWELPGGLSHECPIDLAEVTS